MADKSEGRRHIGGVKETGYGRLWPPLLPEWIEASAGA